MEPVYDSDPEPCPLTVLTPSQLQEASRSFDPCTMAPSIYDHFSNVAKALTNSSPQSRNHNQPQTHSPAEQQQQLQQQHVDHHYLTLQLSPVTSPGSRPSSPEIDQLPQPSQSPPTYPQYPNPFTQLPIASLPISKPDCRDTRRFRCSVRTCDRLFTRKYDMEKHALSVHQAIRPFACDICFRGFCQKHHMERHKKQVHFKQRNHKCHHCPQSFGRKEHLTNHCRAKHAGEERPNCPVCGIDTESGVLEKHLQERHAIAPDRALELSRWHKIVPKPRAKRSRQD